jgi:hypothetical protein
MYTLYWSSNTVLAPAFVNLYNQRQLTAAMRKHDSRFSLYRNEFIGLQGFAKGSTLPLALQSVKYGENIAYSSFSKAEQSLRLWVLSSTSSN